MCRINTNTKKSVEENRANSSEVEAQVGLGEWILGTSKSRGEGRVEAIDLFIPVQPFWVNFFS